MLANGDPECSYIMLGLPARVLNYDALEGFQALNFLLYNAVRGRTGQIQIPMPFVVSYWQIAASAAPGGGQTVLIHLHTT